MGKNNITLNSLLNITNLILTLLILYFYYIDINIYVLLSLIVPLTFLNLYNHIKSKNFGSFGLVSVLFVMLLFSIWIYVFPLQREIHNSSLFPSSLFEFHGENVISAFIISITSVIFAYQVFLWINIILIRTYKHGFQDQVYNDNNPAIKKQAIVISGILVTIIATLMILDIAFIPTIISTPYGIANNRRLTNTPLIMYVHFVFIVFLLHLFLLADMKAPKRKAKAYMIFISLLAFVGFLYGNRGMFFYIFFAWGFYYYIWVNTKTKYLKLTLLLIIFSMIVLTGNYLRGTTIKKAISSGFTEIDFRETAASLPWYIPVIPLAPYQTSVGIDLFNNGDSLKGQSYIDLIPMIIPSFLANALEIKRPVGGAWTYSYYASSVGGLNMVGEAYWNLGRYGPFIAFFIVGILYVLIDRLSNRYGWTGKCVSLYLLYFAVLGVGYGTSSLWRALQLAVFFIIFIHFFLVRRKNTASLLK